MMLTHFVAQISVHYIHQFRWVKLEDFQFESGFSLKKIRNSIEMIVVNTPILWVFALVLCSDHKFTWLQLIEVIIVISDSILYVNKAM